MRVSHIVVVPHVHWDREWYFSCQESQVLAVRDFEEILTHLETHPDYPSFVMDGQMAVVEEFLQTVPEARPRLEALVRSGRLQVGPWYTQTDEMVVGGESIVRNLLYGTEAARKLGGCMKIGYVPDSFGQSAQMPHILQEFGIDRSVFWRGQSQFCGTEANQFMWHSPDGSEVLALQMPLGYATAKYLPSEPDALKKRLGRLIDLMDELSPTPVAVLPNGHDQMPIQTNIDEVIEALHHAFPDRTFVLGSFDDALNLIKKFASEQAIPQVSGEMLDGRRERVHRSIFSVRSDNKVANTQAETLLSRQVEPLIAVSTAVGLPAPRELVRQAWKPALESHAHDSIGGCCSDLVNAQVRARLLESYERGHVLAHYHQRYIAEAAEVSEAGRITLFNMSTCSKPRKVRFDILSKTGQFNLLDEEGRSVDYDVIDEREIDPGLIDRQIVAAGITKPFVATTVELRRALPSVGYETLGIVEGDATNAQKTPQVHTHTSDLVTFATKQYDVEVLSNGTLNLVNRENDHRVVGAFEIQCEGNGGDEYDFSPVEGGKLIRSTEQVSCVPVVHKYEHSIVVEMNYELALPCDEAAWATGAYEGTGRLGVGLTIEFDREDPLVSVDVALNNQADDLRVRLVVPSDIPSELSRADNQFGHIERPVVDPGMEVWEQQGWSERPDAIFPFLSYVALFDEKRTAAVFTNGPREYEVIGSDYSSIAITLLAGTGTLGKTDLFRRPGRPSGIAVETPDGQCRGSLSMRLGLALFASGVKDAHLASQAATWLTPVTTHQVFDYVPIRLSKPNKKVPRSFSLFSQEDPSLALSCVKMAENGDKIITRFINDSDEANELHLQGRQICHRLTLAEKQKELSADELMKVGPRATITVDLEG